MNNEYKMYIITRSDMSPGYQIVQSCHAVADHERNYPGQGKKHGILGNTMVALSVPNEQELKRLFERVRVLAPTTIFWEPDVQEFTAMAVSPSPFYNLFRYLSLAGL